MGSAALLTFSCPGCKRLLKMPSAAAGRRARCGGCKEVVRVPAAEPVDIEDELGDFLSDMVAKDRHPDDHDGFSPPKRFKRALLGGGDDELDRLSPEDEMALDSIGKASNKTPAAAVSQQDAPAPAPAPTPAVAALPARPLTPAAPAAPAPVTASSPAAPGFPVDRTPGPFLEVRSISALGVRLAFPAKQLQDPRFRASMPARCVFSGEPIGAHSYARPMVFNNQHAAGDELVRMVELRHEKAIGADYIAAAFVEETAPMEEMPAPFNLALPYAVSEGHHDSSLQCEGHIGARHDGYCEVVIPSPEAALAWVVAVNGVCHESVQALEDKGSKVSSDAWVRLPQATRDKITMWCTFRKQERFLAYARDSHSTARDAGLGGILVTDKRMIFHLYRTTWSMDLSKPLTLFSQLQGESFALSAKSGDGERKSMCHLLRGDAALVFDALETAAVDLKVETDQKGITAAA